MLLVVNLSAKEPGQSNNETAHGTSSRNAIKPIISSTVTASRGRGQLTITGAAAPRPAPAGGCPSEPGGGGRVRGRSAAPTGPLQPTGGGLGHWHRPQHGSGEPAPQPGLLPHKWEVNQARMPEWRRPPVGARRSRRRNVRAEMVMQAPFPVVACCGVNAALLTKRRTGRSGVGWARRCACAR